MMKKKKMIGFCLIGMAIVGLTFSAAVPGFAACPDGLTAYWKLNDAQGGPYVDFVAGNDGVEDTKTAPTESAQGIDGAQEFASGTGIDVPANSAFNWAATDSFTIECWVKTSSGGTQVFVGRNDGALDWWVGVSGGQVAFNLEDSSGAGGTLLSGVGTTINDGNWHHVAAVRDASSDTNLVYVDGSLQTSAAATYSNSFISDDPLTIGYLNTATFYYTIGLIDEVAVYDEALDQDEIEAHYLSGEDYCGGSGSPSEAPYPEETIGLWPLDEGDGSTVWVDTFAGNDAEALTKSAPDDANGKVDGAQEFASGTGIDVPANGAVNWGATESFTIECWVKTSSADTQVFVGRNDGALDWWVGVLGGQVAFNLEDSSGAGGTLLSGVGTTINDGNWHHVAAVRDASSDTNLVYVNGSLQTSAAATYSNGFISEDPLTIGYLNTGGFYYTVGLIDEVALFNRALDQDEIEDHYEVGLDGDSITTLRADDDDDDDDSSSSSSSGDGGGGGCFISSLF